ncbi:MAG: Sortase (surface protein transpeptidase) [uncultured Rubrobacteraceae bacterium]|uniref:Sortase (Surface protein transpeptidase) n=1 Tax=uncultured Rubrobacteraceae bacterium TaxID=349277 RepID=A0A6J4NGW0_9ACTN|nr:MAG: Sortase (surface protein transpeptidase) [uncultured Rubrobacteraceae bacterium]
MKKIKGARTGRVVTAGVAAAVLFVGLGLLLLSVFGGQAPASANTPQKVSDQVTEEVQERFARSLPERIVEKVRGPRVDAPEEKTLKLSVPSLDRVQDVPVYDAGSGEYEEAMHDGTAHVRGTGFPWQKGANVYIAGHRVGYPGTKSNLVFWDLDKLEKGDEILLTDADGERYTYTVYKKFVVDPNAVEVLRPVPGKSVVSLQTCTLPDYSRRLVVQGELTSS